jgi:hypothetical protein
MERSECTICNLDYFQAKGISKEIPLSGLGSGDSSLYLDVLPEDMKNEIFDNLNAEIEWNVMTHKGGSVPRLISIQGEREFGTCFPLYRHPADEQPSTVDFTPQALQCRDVVSNVLGQRFNHALIQKYRDGKDNISEHADKTLDIARGTAIVNLSVGATRVMILKSKPDYPGNPSSIDEYGNVTVGKIVQKVTLPPNSLFVLGWETNLHFTHSIKADKRHAWEKRPDERLYDEQRISLTFRNIATYLSPTGQVFGQGARIKQPPASVRPTPDLVDHTLEDVDAEGCREEEQLAEGERLLRAFGVENRTATFDWDEHYGGGFDIVNFQIVNSYCMRCS